MSFSLCRTIRCISVVAALTLATAAAHAQSTPYARSFAKPKPEVEQALKDLQAYTGQKLPILDGFVGPVSKPLDRYERGFYQFTIELLPGGNGATIVRLSAKITAWYADRDVSKSGYDVLPSNGRLELDFLDRLNEKLGGKPVAAPASAPSDVQAPKPKLDLSGVPGAALPSQPSAIVKTPDEVAALRGQRVVEERRVQQLTTQLENLQEIQKNQAHPQDLVSVEKSGTPIYAKASPDSRVLFQASANDEFEFIDSDHGWVHIQISGDSRGYVQQSAVLLPELIAARIAKEEHGPEERFTGFRIEHDEMSNFPADWPGLKGKTVKIYTVQPVSQNAKETGPSVRLEYALALFQKGLKESATVSGKMEGVMVIFDAADGGIAAATLGDIQKVLDGSLTHDGFWKQSYLDPIEAFQAAGTP
ncbi:MAG TPA: SH3 domain-containing protein [Candidatus Sulfotelmatobacter sp.]|nr:SH3 domain-containing protein [Candidatus Sulfotelmatobacter sp.]